MSLRTTSDEVEAVLIGFTITSGQLDSFIADASLWVDNRLEGKTCVDADKLATIEKYLAAHLFALSQQGMSGQVIARGRSDINEKYASPSASEAGKTSYLRTAAAFDPCGIVAEDWLGVGRVRAYVGSGYMYRGTVV
jgi:hypothetical protein